MGSWLVVVLLLVTGAATADASSGTRYYVLEDGTEVRHHPGFESPVVARLSRGNEVVEFRRQGGWVKVGVFRAVGKNGWVHGSLLGTEPPPGTVEAERRPEEPEATLRKYELEELPAFLLDISGSPAREFRATCRRVRADGELDRIGILGTVPKTYRIEASAVNCLVQKREARGRLRADLLLSNRIIASKDTAAAFNWVRVRSHGPWGKAASIRGDIRTPIFRTTGRRSPLLPPIAGPLPSLGR